MHLPQRREHRRRLPQATSLSASVGWGRSGVSIQHGVRANLVQHALLAANVAFIGAMVGVERKVVPL